MQIINNSHDIAALNDIKHTNGQAYSKENMEESRVSFFIRQYTRGSHSMDKVSPPLTTGSIVGSLTSIQRELNHIIASLCL